MFFKKGQPAMCPNKILEDAMAVGILPTDDADLPQGPNDGPLPTESSGSARIAQIRDIIEALMRRNGRGDFTASGVPSKRVVEGALGYRIDESELGKVWHTMRQENADNRAMKLDDLSLDGPEKPEDKEELKVALQGAIVSIMENGTADDFTAAGVPLVRSMTNRLQYDVSEDERDSSWADYCLTLDKKKVVGTRSHPKVKGK